MARQLPPWIRDILILPVSVGVAVAIFGFFLPKAFADDKELSYSVEGPVTYLDSVAGQALGLTVGGQGLPRLIGYKVRIWNSGDLPLEDLPVLLLFKDPAPGFRIVNAHCSSIPFYEFGDITEQATNDFSRRYTVKLMNPGDTIDVAILTTGRAGVELFSKSKDMRLRRTQIP